MQQDHARGYLPTKPQAQPAEDVIHHRARLADLGISEKLDDGPVMPRDERIQEVQASH